MTKSDAGKANGRAEQQLQILSRATALLASSLAFEDSLAHTVAACLPALGDFGFFDVVVDDGVRRTVRAHEDPVTFALLAPSQWQRQESTELNLCALSTGLPALHRDIDDAWYRAVATGDAHLALLRQLGFRSMITVPLHYRGDLVGALTLFMARSGRCHDADDLAFAQELAALAAPVVTNMRLLEQHRRAEAALRQSEERLRLATNAGQLGIWDWDIVEDRITWSERVYELHGLVPGSFGGRGEDFPPLIHPQDRDEVMSRLSRAVKELDTYAVEFRTVLPDGTVRWLSAHAMVSRDDNGRALRMVGAVQDVTDRVALLAAERAAHAAAAAARHRSELLAAAGSAFSQSLAEDQTLQAISRVLVPQMADWCRIDLVDHDGVAQHVLSTHSDPAKAEMAAAFGRARRAPASMVGSIDWVIANTKPFLLPQITDSVLQFIEDAQVRVAIEEFGLCASVCVPLVARGRTLGALSLAQAESGRTFSEDDQIFLSELAQRAALSLDNARLYAQAEQALREAETANQAKDQFLAMLGHELRNPLAPMMTALELMAVRGDASTSYEQGVLSRQLDHLARLVDDLLDIARITRGKVELSRTQVDLGAVLAQAIEQVRPALDANRLQFEYEKPNRGCVINGDAVRLAQVFTNLLSNAAKFTPSGGSVRLCAGCDGQQACVSVSDSGIGIASDLLPHVFDQFVQGVQNSDRKSGGLGLGLTIARSLVGLHGGSISVESAGSGMGSRFEVRLPCVSAVGTAPATTPTQTADAGGVAILVVDDNLDAGQTLCALLGARGFLVRHAADGTSALALLQDFTPQVAILDIGLPGMDGYLVGSRLRERLPGLRLVALTGYGRDTDVARAHAAGFECHLTKPIAQSQLMAALTQLLVKPGAPTRKDCY